MDEYYYLMHKDTVCGVLKIDTESGTLSNFRSNRPDYMPFFGHGSKAQMQIWWNNRAVPGSRKDMAEIFHQAGCTTPSEYLVKNLGLSLTDSYWICPDGSRMKWKDINLYRHILIKKPFVPYHNASSFDPNASLGGQMEKYWDLSGDIPVLVKKSPLYHGQQAVNEAFATLLHFRQKTDIPYVPYSVQKSPDDGIYCSVCPAFTSEKYEFISAYEMVSSELKPNNKSMYEHFIDVCVLHGLDREQVQRFLDYQTLTDFVLSNTDEHLMNFGVLRNTDTMDLTGPSPIFDTGNSMFYNADDNVTPYTRSELLGQKITGIHDREERMLEHVKYKNVVNTSRLPSVQTVKDFYMQYGLDPSRAAFLAQNYGIKCEMLEEFQHGLKISIFLEKRREQSQKHSRG